MYARTESPPFPTYFTHSPCVCTDSSFAVYSGPKPVAEWLWGGSWALDRAQPAAMIKAGNNRRLFIVLHLAEKVGGAAAVWNRTHLPPYRHIPKPPYRPPAYTPSTADSGGGGCAARLASASSAPRST